MGKPRSTRPEIAAPESEPEQLASGRSRPLWGVIAGLLITAGIVASVGIANAVARRDATESRDAFEKSSADVASTLQLGIQHEEDLVVNASAFMLANPHTTNAEFARWTNDARVLGRYSELLGVGASVIVPASELPAFAARVVAQGPGLVGPDKSFAVDPPGKRPFYCLETVEMYRDPAMVLPMDVDLCAAASSRIPLLAARDSGQGSYVPYTSGGQTTLGVVTPIYAGGGVPTNVDARRKAFAGWVGTLVAPNIVLDRALRDHPGLSVSMRYHLDSSTAAFTRGQAPRPAQSLSIDLRNGWTVETAGAVSGTGLVSDRNALSVMLTGLTLTGLMTALVLVLGTGRTRAERIVDQRTGELRHQALHDALTDLPNRALIMDRIDRLLARGRRNGTSGAVLFIDLDDFKNVNDSLGHAAGDRLLVDVAARLTSTFRESDTVGRMGGDEFVMLVDGGRLDIAPEVVAERLLDAMRAPFDLGHTTTPLVITTSIGIAVGDRPTPGNLLRDADVALYQAKAAGKNRYAVFEPEMEAQILRGIELEFELRSALDRDQFRLVYQPIYNLDDLSLVGVEALLRWDHPTLGTVQPDDFVPILERTGQIQEVGRWVLVQACEQMATWHGRGDTLDLSVNVSGRQLDDEKLAEQIREVLDTSGLEATSLIIEVTETTLMQNVDATAAWLRDIKELGVRIAVDDFGTGYSSLGYLQHFPVDCLKLDRSFTNAIAASAESNVYISTLVRLGKELGLKILAEGVETTDEMDQLRAQHVDEAQGFLLSVPLDPETLERTFLAPRRPVVPTSNTLHAVHHPSS